MAEGGVASRAAPDTRPRRSRRLEEAAMADLIDELLRRWRGGSDHRSRQEASARAPKREEGVGAPTRDSLAELLRVDDTRSPRFWVLADRPVILAQTSANSSRSRISGALRPMDPPR